MPLTFSSFQAANDDTSTCTTGCNASSGTPFLTYSISPSIVGISFNPITRTAVLADPNATGSQISFIDPKSQTVSSMSLFSEETGTATTGAPELGAAEVAFQPFSNTAVSFNPKTNEVLAASILLSRSASCHRHHRSKPGLLPCASPVRGVLVTCDPKATPPQSTVTILGAVAVEPVSNTVLTLNSFSGTLTGFKLGNIKTVPHRERVQTPAIDGSNISVPANFQPGGENFLGHCAPASRSRENSWLRIRRCSFTKFGSMALMWPRSALTVTPESAARNSTSPSRHSSPAPLLRPRFFLPRATMLWTSLPPPQLA